MPGMDGMWVALSLPCPLYRCGSYVFSTWKDVFLEESGVPQPTGQEFRFGMVSGNLGGST